MRRDRFEAVTLPLAEPMLLVSPTGTVLAHNPAAARAVPGIGVGADLCELVLDAPQSVRGWLLRCATAARPLAGVLTFRAAGGSGLCCRCQGARVPVSPH